MSPDDPRCPECGEAISATASYCPHCYADMEEDATVEATAVDLDGSASEAVATGETATGGHADGAANGDAGENVESEEADTDVATRRASSGRDAGRGPADSGADDRGWFHPDGLLDDVSTGLVGVVAGGVAGFLAMVLVVIGTDSAVGFLTWPVGWVGVGLYVGWTRTVFGAVRKACYVLAPTLVVLPLFSFAPALESGSVGGRVFAFVVSETVLLPVAAVLAGVGYRLGKTATDTDVERSGTGSHTRARPTGDAVDPSEGAVADDRGWFHPDSLLDDVSTGLVGVVAGLVVGTLAMTLAWLVTASPWAFLVGPIGWVAVGLYVGWTRSVFTAVEKACYVVAPTLVAQPLFWFGQAVEGGSLGGTIFAFAVSEIVALPIALVFVGIGYWVGGMAPD